MFILVILTLTSLFHSISWKTWLLYICFDFRAFSWFSFRCRAVHLLQANLHFFCHKFTCGANLVRCINVSSCTIHSNNCVTSFLSNNRGILYLYLSLTFSLYLVAANQIIRPRYAKLMQSVLLKKVPSLIKRMRESADRHS